MIYCFLKPTIWRPTINCGKHTLLGLVYCFFIIVGLLITTDIHAFFNVGDRVVLQNTSRRNIRSEHRVADETWLATIDQGTRGTFLQGPKKDGGYTWYEVRWDTPNGELDGWIADSPDGCPFFIDLVEIADKRDVVVEKLFNMPHEKTNHDYNDYGCNLNWRVNGKLVYQGGHSGWDAQTQTVAGAKPTVNEPFYSLTTGKVIFVGGKFGTIAVHNADDEKTVLYLHARRIDVEKNDDVIVGTPLGIQGNTGITLPAVIPEAYKAPHANPNDYPENYMEHVHIEVIDGKPEVVLEHGPADGAADPKSPTIPPIPYLYESVSAPMDPNPPVVVDPSVVVVGHPVLTLEGHTRRVNSVAFSPNGSIIASGSDDETIRLWDAITGNYKQTLVEHTRDINDVAFSPDGRIIAGGSDDDNIYLWSAVTGRDEQILEGHTRRVNSVAFSPNGSIIASGSDDETIRLWDAITGRQKQTLEEHTADVNSVAFSPDGRTLASGSDDETIRLWDAITGNYKQTLVEHTRDINDVAFSPDGRIIAGGSDDDNIYLWDATTGRLRQTFEGHTGDVNSIAFSPDGRTLASGSDDDTVRIWDTATGREKQILEEHTGNVNSIAFSPDGRTLASGSDDDTVRIWRVDTGATEPLRLAEDVDADGSVTIQDLVLVARNFGQTGENAADVDGDGVVDIDDLVLVASVLEDTVAGAPSTWYSDLEVAPTRAQVQKWLSEARKLNQTDVISQRGIRFLEQLLMALPLEKTALLPNYPNPFNPETWIPYQLSEPADVNISIYAVDGKLVRTLAFGHQPVGIYESKNRAAYWDGRNTLGEPVASGVYFYTLTAGDFTATRKMLIRK